MTLPRLESKPSEHADQFIPLAGLEGGVSRLSGQCAIQNGGVKCFGQDSSASGIFGDQGRTTKSDTPVTIKGLESDVTDVAMFWSVIPICAVKSGQVWCWGGGDTAILGNGEKSSYRSSPTLVLRKN